MVENTTYYRPEWTCGRYNRAKRVAIFYNLITGYSYFFEDFSAVVIGEILKAKRNGEVSMDEVAEHTGIAKESIIDFFEVLMNVGLLVGKIPTEEDIAKYRMFVAEQKIVSQTKPKSTVEKLPMDVSNAEQSYYAAIEDVGVVTSVMFEMTYNCSEQCIHCYNPGATRNNSEVSHRGDRNELQLDDYKRIIDDLNNHGLVKVCLTGGDPFSKPITWDVIDYLYEKEIAFDIFTNGQRLVNDVDRLAGYYPRLVGVSIYSGLAEDHDAITRIKGSWDRSMKVVKRLSELAVPMNLKCCVMQPNLHSYYMVADIACQFGAQPQFEVNISDSNEGDICARQLRLTEEQLQVVLRDDNIPMYVGPEAPNYGGQSRLLSMNACGAGKTTFCVTPEGNMQPCCAFPMRYGNMKEQSVSEILIDNPIVENWVHAKLEDYVECGHYEYCDYCNLCAGTNYIENGDFRKASENCCYMAKVRYNLAHKMMNGYDPLKGKGFVETLKSLPKSKLKLQRKYENKG